MESVDKLRARIYDSTLSKQTREDMECIADEIEEEFALYSLRNYPKPFGSPEAMHMVLGTAADNFDTPEEAVDYMNGETSMPLPVDADGVPVRIGDHMERTAQPEESRKVNVLKLDEYGAWWYGTNAAYMYAVEGSVHHKPRTLEDVLAEFGRESVGASMQQTNALLTKYADEIRELIGGDAE